MRYYNKNNNIIVNINTIQQHRKKITKKITKTKKCILVVVVYLNK